MGAFEREMVAAIRDDEVRVISLSGVDVAAFVPLARYDKMRAELERLENLDAQRQRTREITTKLALRVPDGHQTEPSDRV